MFVVCEDGQSRMRKQAIEDTIIAKGQLRFTDIAGLEEAKKTLKDAIIMPLQFPHLFTGKIIPHLGVG